VAPAATCTCGWLTLNLVVIPAKAGIQGVHGIARFARDSENLIAGGSAPAPWVTWARTIPGLRPAGRLRLSKFDPVEFVFARAKKRNPPAVREPQLTVEIARKARDTIQGLDSRFRGNDGNVSNQPPANSFSNRRRRSK